MVKIAFFFQGLCKSSHLAFLNVVSGALTLGPQEHFLRSAMLFEISK